MPRLTSIKPSQKHRPDSSDASFSFQIPADFTTGEFLLADRTDDLEFLRHLREDDSFAELQLPPKHTRIPHIVNRQTPKLKSIPVRLPKSPAPTYVPDETDAAEGVPLETPHQRHYEPIQPSQVEDQELKIITNFPEAEEPLALGRTSSSRSSSVDGSLPIRPTCPKIPSSPSSNKALGVKTKCRTKWLDQQTATNGGIMKSAAAKPAAGSKCRTTHQRATFLDDRSSLSTLTTHPSIPEIQGDPPSTALSAATSESDSIPVVIKQAQDFGTPDTTDGPSVATTAPAADDKVKVERPQVYSPRLVSSIRPFSIRSESTVTAEVCAHATDVASESRVAEANTSRGSTAGRFDNHASLMLSEISPRKAQADENTYKSIHPSSNLTKQADRSPSHACKRPLSALNSNEEERSSGHGRGTRKRGKTVPPDADSTQETGSSKPSLSSTHVLRSSRFKNQELPIARNGRGPKLPTSHAPVKLRASPRRSAAGKGPALPAGSSRSPGRSAPESGRLGENQEALVHSLVASSSTSTITQSSRSRHHIKEATINRKRNLPEKHGQSRSRPRDSENLTATLPLANATVPVPFTFRSDVRIQARQADCEEKQVYKPERRVKQRLPVPDFKTSHLVQSATTLASRKERIVPVLPIATGGLYTEQRAREREMFDEMLRRKEEEMERLKEERRREQEADEEREIKELRRKAVPKAHEIPEWYADMPKRKVGSAKT